MKPKQIKKPQSKMITMTVTLPPTSGTVNKLFVPLFLSKFKPERKIVDDSCQGEIWLSKGPDGAECVVKAMRNGPAAFKELEAYKETKHENVLELRDSFSSPDAVNLVFDYCDEGDLFHQIMKVGVKNGGQVKTWTRQVCSAVAYIHSKKLVHLDIKPENIFVIKGVLKLADFGMAAFVDESYHVRGAWGTGVFRAPEQLYFNKYSGPSLYKGDLADVWSIGVLVYAMITAKLPFNEGIVEHIYRNIFLAGPKKANPIDDAYLAKTGFNAEPHGSSEAKKFMCSCLAFEPNDRPGARQLLADAWLA